MKRSPVKIIELCVYIIVIIAAIFWTAMSGKKINSFDSAPITDTTKITETQTTKLSEEIFYDAK